MNKENKKLEISFERVEAAYKSTENESVKETLEALFGKEAFKDQAKDFLDYRNIKSLKDVSEALGKDMDEFKKSLSNLPRDVQAFMVLREIRNALNPKWVPDFANTNQYKYYPWFEIKKSPAGVGDAHNGSHLGVSVCTRAPLPRTRMRSAGVPLLPKNRKSQSGSVNILPICGKNTCYQP